MLFLELKTGQTHGHILTVWEEGNLPPGILDILERTSLEQPVRGHPLFSMLKVCTQDKGEQR